VAILHSKQKAATEKPEAAQDRQAAPLPKPTTPKADSRQKSSSDFYRDFAFRRKKFFYP
jgi:hypothetical protein